MMMMRRTDCLCALELRGGTLMIGVTYGVEHINQIMLLQ